MASASAVPLLIGLAVQAATTYIVLVIAGRALGASGFGRLSALYVMITSIATGLFLPLEQEVARRRGAERGQGVWDSSLLRRALTFGFFEAGSAVAVLLAAFPVSLRLLGHDPQLLAALCVALPGYACCFVSRGEFAGRREFARYGVQLAAEGGSRICGALILVLADVHGTSCFGWLFAGAPWLAVGVSVYRWPHRSAAPHPVRVEPLPRRIGLLTVSCLASQLLINAGPLVVALLARPHDRSRVGVYLAALVLARIPVFLFTAVQPSFLPSMAEHAAADRRDEFVRLIRRVLAACAGVTAMSSLLAWAAGPEVLRLIFGFPQTLSHATCFQISISVGLFLISAVLAQSLLGRAEHGATVRGWVAGLAGLGFGTALGHDPVSRAGTGFLSGALVATLVFSVLFARTLRHWPLPSQKPVNAAS